MYYVDCRNNTKQKFLMIAKDIVSDPDLDRDWTRISLYIRSRSGQTKMVPKEGEKEESSRLKSSLGCCRLLVLLEP